jgi:pectate lyase
MKDIVQHVKDTVSAALEGSFTDANVYGVGFIRVSLDENRNLVVQHVPFKQLNVELERVVEQQKWIYNG